MELPGCDFRAYPPQQALLKGFPMTAEAILADARRTIAAGPFTPTWRSLEHYQVPDWYKNAKFGIFIHWGAYSVAGFGNEWYPRAMYDTADRSFKHHLETFGPHDQIGYKDLIARFRGEKFDPYAWANLFREAGARYVMPVAEHHDGFAMYDYPPSRWTALRTGPKRDVIGELSAAVRQAGLRFTASSHRAEHWWFFCEGRKCQSDVNDPALQDLYGPAQPRESQPDRAFLEDWLARTCQLVTRYSPSIIYFDWWIEQPAFAPYLKEFAAFYYNWAAANGQEVAINYKINAFPVGAAVFDVERGQLDALRPVLWQTDTSVSKNSWGFIHKHDYKTPRDIVQDLIDIVSKNGSLLLNVGPAPDGLIPEPEQVMLRQIGRWLRDNGEAIYDTRPWKIFGEGPTQVAAGGFTDSKRQSFTAQDFRFTSKEDIIYCLGMQWPADGVAHIAILGTAKAEAPLKIQRVQLLEHDAPLPITRDEKGLHVTLPRDASDDFPYALRVTTGT